MAPNSKPTKKKASVSAAGIQKKSPSCVQTVLAKIKSTADANAQKFLALDQQSVEKGGEINKKLSSLQSKFDAQKIQVQAAIKKTSAESKAFRLKTKTHEQQHLTLHEAITQIERNLLKVAQTALANAKEQLLCQSSCIS
jgi:hypothetical protein